MKKELLNKRDCYTLKGIAMILIIISHIVGQLSKIYFWKIPILTFILSWGYISTGVFFFLSGYGMFYSLTRKPHIGYHYVYCHLISLLKPFLICWFISSVLAYFLFHIPVSHLFENLLMLQIGDMSTWFFKVILGIYIFCFILYSIRISNKIRLILISTFCLIYVIITILLGFENYWYLSVMNFPLGMLCALNYDKIKNIISIKVCWWCLILYMLLYLGSYYFAAEIIFSISMKIIASLSFSIFSIGIIQYITVFNKLLTFTGHNSIYMYLGQFIFLYTIADVLLFNVVLFVLVVWGGTYSIAFLFGKKSSLLTDK